MLTLDLVVPCYNEEESIPLFYEETKKVLNTMSNVSAKFIFVNDGSKDKTMQILTALSEKDERVKYISFSKNFGKEAAMLAGMQFSCAEVVGILDADLQHPPTLIPDMLSAITEEDYDIAAGCRGDRGGESKIKSAFSHTFYKLCNRITDAQMEDGAQDFRLMKRKVVDAILNMPEYNRFSKGIFSWVGFKTKWFPHENIERVAGKTKWSFWELVSYGIDGIVNFSTAPLKISLVLGSFSSMIGLIYALYIIVRTLIFGSDVPGYPSIICAIMIFGDFILLSMGVLGEYIARIYKEVKNRPNYIVDKTNILPENPKKN